MQAHAGPAHRLHGQPRVDFEQCIQLTQVRAEAERQPLLHGQFMAQRGRCQAQRRQLDRRPGRPRRARGQQYAQQQDDQPLHSCSSTCRRRCVSAT
ncbi:MAG: hypothetical protein DI562_19385 [Stenotrophomonas acidaminiphila]|nr:MAG: hypothetical protein DI562_19385 [Stenotrophomonas acidaminiphila]